MSPPMLVLEFMEGGDLWSALRGPHREELQWYGRGRALALDIARGLHFLHEHKARPLLAVIPSLSQPGRPGNHLAGPPSPFCVEPRAAPGRGSVLAQSPCCSYIHAAAPAAHTGRLEIRRRSCCKYGVPEPLRKASRAAEG